MKLVGQWGRRFFVPPRVLFFSTETPTSSSSSRSMVDAFQLRNVTTEPDKKKKQQQDPWLILSKKVDDPHEKSGRSFFFSLDETQMHKIELFSNTAAANRSWSWCCSAGGSNSDGNWLVMSDHKTTQGGNFLYTIPIITQQQQQISTLLPPPHVIISTSSFIRSKEEKLDQIDYMDKANIVSSSVPTITNSSSSLNSSSSCCEHDYRVAAIYEKSCRDGFSGVVLQGFCDKEWCNVHFHKYCYHNYYRDGGEEKKNMVLPIEVASVEGEGGSQDNNGEEKKNMVLPIEVASVEGEGGSEDNNGEEEEEEYEHQEEIAVVEGKEDEDSNSEKDDGACRKFTSDIIFDKGALYVVIGRRTTNLVIVNISSSISNHNHPSSGNNKLERRVRWHDIQPVRLNKSEKHILNNYYLVESCGGELLMVIRIRRKTKNMEAIDVLKTRKFGVFKLVETGDTLKWVRAESLDDQILVVDCNHCKCVSVSDLPRGYRGNCIYFTDYIWLEDFTGDSDPVCLRDIGVFFLEDEGGNGYNNGEEEEYEHEVEVAVEGGEDEDSNSKEEDEDDVLHDEACLKFPSDIIFYEGALYVVTGRRTTNLGFINISSCSNHNHHPSSSGDDNNNKLKRIVRWPDIQPLRLKKSEKHILNNYFLVESCRGEWLMVIRIRRETKRRRKAIGILKTKKFVVFKLDETGNTLKWVRAESLGDQILFLGCNQSKSVSVSDMPRGCRGNCIYFTDHIRFRFMRGYSGPVCYRDTGVFLLEDEKIDPIFPKMMTISHTTENIEKIDPIFQVWT